MVVTAPSLETQVGLQNQTQTQTLTETINQSMTLNHMSSIQQDMANIYKQTQSVITGMQVFIKIIENISKIKDQVANIAQFENLAGSQGINLPQVFSGLENKFMQCSELANSAAEQDMTPAERIDIVMEVSMMIEEIISTISGIKTSIFSNIKSNFITKHVKDCLKDSKLTPFTLNFNSK